MMELNAIVDKEQNNLLNFAVQSGYYDMVELLIKNGLPINNKNVSAALWHFLERLSWGHPLLNCVWTVIPL